MKKLFLLAALFVAAAFSSCSKHDDVETPDLPETTPLAIAFAEGNSLELGVNETKTVHYTITGGSDKTIVKAEMQKSDDAYTVKTTSASATEGTIAITAKTPETENCVIVTVSDGSQSVTAEIAVSTNAIPEKLAITFAEGNSLEFNVNETKTVHYTITGGSDNTVVKAELQTANDAYIVETTPTSATEGTITITAKTPETENCVIVTVSDGSQTVTAEIAVTVTLKASFDGKTVVVEIPGTLSQLLADYDQSAITELTVIGNLNDEDIATLNNLPNLAVLDMENVNLEVLPAEAFKGNKSLTSVKLPRTLTSIGDNAFRWCSSLTSVTIPNSVTSIGVDAFCWCYSLTNVTIPDSVTTIGGGAFDDCRGLTSIIIGNSVTEIGVCAFQNCSSLTNITIPDSVTSISNWRFVGCSSLSAFYGKFASSDNRCLIVDGKLIAFAPAGLTSYAISDSVTSIEPHAFQDCKDLISITIPNSVTSIGQAAFYDCRGLTAIYCKAIAPPHAGSTLFYSTFFNVNATLYVPIGRRAAYSVVDGWKEFETIIETQF